MVRNAAKAAVKSDNAKYEMFKRIREAVKTLNTLQTNAQTLEKIRQERDKRAHLNIPHMQQFAARAGISEVDMNRLNVIHVSGTKGKGSTCAFCESLLHHHGYKTGFFSSPHLVEVRERFEVNGIAIEQEKFASYFWEVYNSLDKSKTDHEGLMPNYFGFLTVMALHVFLKEKVDVAIMEVGIGGQYDSTNVVRNPVVCGVTSLGLDHTSILGTTIDKIAWHKAGIFKPGVPAFTVPQPPEAMKVLQERAVEIGCSLTVCPDISAYGTGVRLGIKGSVQGQNASLALQLSHMWMKRFKDREISREMDSNHSALATGEMAPQNFCDIQPAEMFPLSEQHRKGLEQCRWLGRNQTVRKPDVTYYIDGAHTLESIQQCVEWFLLEAGEEKHHCKNGVYRVLIFNTTGDRETACLLRPLLSCGFDAVLFCPNLAYERAVSADQTNNTVTKESQLSRCIENQRTWEYLCREAKMSALKLSQSKDGTFTNGLSEFSLPSIATNGIAAGETRISGFVEDAHVCTSQALPSISQCIDWVCKQHWMTEKNPVVNGEVQVVVNGVVDQVVNAQGGSQKPGDRYVELQSESIANGFVNGASMDGLENRPFQSEFVNGTSMDGLENKLVRDEAGASGSVEGNRLVQVLITGSLHLVGGALKVLGDRQNQEV